MNFTTMSSSRDRASAVLCMFALAELSSACAAPKPELPPPSSSSFEDDDEDADSGTDDGQGDDASEPTPLLDMGDGGAEGGDHEPSVTCGDAAAIGSQAGCEFWALDLPSSTAGGGGAGSSDPQYAVAVVNGTGISAAFVQVFVGSETMPVATVELGRGEAHRFELPSMNVEPASATEGGIAYRIESDVPITAYQWYPFDASGALGSSDASLLLPTHLLGSQYSAVTGSGLWSADSFSFLGAFVSVVAVEDGTVVDVFPTWHNLVGGSAQSVMLDRGEVFTVLSQSDNPFPQLPLPQAELSGSRIVASKAVAVFSGNVATQEPITTCCADHLEEQLLPIEAWGTDYAVAPPPARGGDGYDPAAYRIVGAVDGTELVYSPEAPTGAPLTIDADETVRFESDQPFTVTSPDPDEPFSITQFLLSRNAVDGETPSGDPAMIGLPALDHFGPVHVVYAPEGFAASFATIVREAGSEVISADVAGMGAAQWQPLGSLRGVEYELAALPVGAGPHVIACESPCAVVSIGYGEAVSYGYVAGLEAMTTDWPPQTGPGPANQGM